MGKVLLVLLSPQVLLATALCLLFYAIAMAGPGHDKYHSEFYSTLKQKNGISCCNDKDCKPVSKHRWNKEVGWQFWYKKSWLTIPKDRIQFKVTPDGGAHLCSAPLDRRPGRYGTHLTGVYVICAIIPFKGF